MYLYKTMLLGDLAQGKFTGTEQNISDNMYVRGDWTQAFYSSEEA